MKKLTLFAALAALLLITGCKKESNPLNRALKSLRNENWKEADIASQEAIEKMPENVNAQIIRALVCEKMNRYAEAVDHALSACSRNGNSFIPLYTLGRFYSMDPRRSGEATALLTRANRLRPDNAETLILLANMQPPGRKKNYLDALQQLPEYRDSLELRFEQAMDRVYRRDRNGVEEEYLKLFSKAGDNPELIYAISGYFYICGNKRTRQVATVGYRRYLAFPVSRRDARRSAVAENRLPGKKR